MHPLFHWKRVTDSERMKVLKIIIMMKSDKILTMIITMAQKIGHKLDDYKNTSDI